MSLKITRKPLEELYHDQFGQSAVIVQTSDGEIRFEIEALRGNQASIAIDAPQNCSIVREELLE